MHDDGTGPALYAGGEFRSYGDLLLGHVARFDGTAWAPLGIGTDGDVLALESFDDGTGAALYAGGHFAAAGATAASNVARWKGGQWYALGAGVDSFGTVNALVAHDDGSGSALYVGGAFSQVGGGVAAGLARWRQGAWSAAGNFANGQVFALLSASVAGSRSLFAGGSFTSVDGSPAAAIARWNGVAWSALGNGRPGAVQALALWQGDKLAAAGSIAAVFGIWDGTQWSEPPVINPTGVSALTAWDDGGGDSLFAGGSFTTVGPVMKGVARWNGTAWSPLAGGVEGTVSALRGFEDASGAALYLGGSFRVVDRTSSYGIARWARPLTCADRTPPVIAITAPTADEVTGARPPLAATYSDDRSEIDTSTLQWSLDGVDFAASCSTTSTTADCTPATNLADGPHQLRAAVADTAGNLGVSPPVSITVSADPPPSISITAPTAGLVRQARPQLAATYSDVGSGIDPPSLQWSLDGTDFGATCTSSATSATCTPTADLAEGGHQLRASIADLGGHRTTSPAVAITIDSVGPNLMFTAPVADAILATATPEVRIS
jgi:hypothetical protein